MQRESITPAARLAMFAVVLAAAFACAWIAGDAIGPSIEESEHGAMQHEAHR